MSHVTSNISIYQGDTFEYVFRLREKSGGAYRDLTGYTGKAQVRATEDSGTVLAEFTVTIMNQATARGGVYLVLSSAQTGALPATGGVWDVQLTNTSSQVHTYIKGTVTVTKEVTRV